MSKMKRKVKRSSEVNEIFLEDAFDDYMSEKEASNISVATISSYKNSFKKFVGFVGEDKKTSDVDERVIFAWINSMKNDGIKPVSINHFLREIRAFLYWCMNETREYITPNFKVKLITEQDETFKIFNDDEIDAILERPQNKNDFAAWRTYTIIHLVLDTGFRAGTIVNMKIGDVDLFTKDIILSHTKNNKSQRVPMSSALYNCLKEYIRDWRKNAKSDEYLFCNIGAEKLTTRALRLALMRYCKKRGVTRLTKDGKIEGKSNIHGLRHTFAKGWIQGGNNVFELQKVLGHSSLDMTRKYVNLYDADIKENYDKKSPLSIRKKNMSRRKNV